MTKKTLILFIGLIVLAGIAGGAYWYFLMRTPDVGPINRNNNPSNNSGGFSPISRPVSQNNSTSTDITEPEASPTPTQTSTKNTPDTLRLISETPVGGYGMLTTATTTIIRWVDRGRGNVYETTGESNEISTLSNTILPRIYNSLWNKNITSFIGNMIDSEGNDYSTIFAELKLRPAEKSATTSTSTAISTVTKYELKGKELPQNIVTIAVSPKKDKIFFVVAGSDKGTGYVSTFDGKNIVKIFDTPVTEITADWPTEDSITINTKAASDMFGFMYKVDPKTGKWKKLVSGLPGMQTKMSHDGKYVIISASGSNRDVVTSVYNIQKNTGTSMLVKTMADKCVWGNQYKNIVYCAVPSQLPVATYPDDWYVGSVVTSDKIWQINADTGELHLVSSIVDKANRQIDAYNLILDEKDNYLLFTNKRDLSLWSLDLTATN